jgi:MFS family permease
VFNAYALTFGVLLLSGGKHADLLGRRAIFIAGLVIFTGALLLCGLAGGAASLIAAHTGAGHWRRAHEPGTLSIITATVPAAPARDANRDPGVSALALAIGPLLGGLLTQDISWSWIFFINIPVGVAGRACGPDLHRRDARHLARAAPRSSRPDRLGGRPVRVHLRVDRDQ